MGKTISTTTRREVAEAIEKSSAALAAAAGYFDSATIDDNAGGRIWCRLRDSEASLAKAIAILAPAVQIIGDRMMVALEAERLADFRKICPEPKAAATATAAPPYEVADGEAKALAEIRRALAENTSEVRSLLQRVNALHQRISEMDNRVFQDIAAGEKAREELEKQVDALRDELSRVRAAADCAQITANSAADSAAKPPPVSIPTMQANILPKIKIPQKQAEAAIAEIVQKFKSKNPTTSRDKAGQRIFEFAPYSGDEGVLIKAAEVIAAEMSCDYVLVNLRDGTKIKIPSQETRDNPAAATTDAEKEAAEREDDQKPVCAYFLWDGGEKKLRVVPGDIGYCRWGLTGEIYHFTIDRGEGGMVLADFRSSADCHEKNWREVDIAMSKLVQPSCVFVGFEWVSEVAAAAAASAKGGE